MTELGAFASEFNMSSRTLKSFNGALRSIRESSRRDDRETVKLAVNSLLTVLQPITIFISGKLSYSLAFDEESIVEILHKKHEKDWQDFYAKLFQITDRLSKLDISFTDGDFNVLDDIGDAMDMQCAHLFKRISGRV